jgi:hypothetical protein
MASEPKPEPLLKAKQNRGNNGTLIRGNAPTYAMARLERDRPDF